jgi:hypothetical protein
MIYYANGDAIEFTGGSTEQHGTKFYQAVYIEGYNQGTDLVISQRDKDRQEKNHQNSIEAAAFKAAQ